MNNSYKKYLFILHTAFFSLSNINLSHAVEPPKQPGLVKKKYIHSCPAGTEKIGDAPPKSTVIFCRQELSDGQRLQGDFTAFYRNGNKKREGEYNSGKKEGSWRDYYRTGEIAAEREYSEGKIKKSKVFDKKGRALEKDKKRKEIIKAETAYQELSKSSRYANASVKQAKISQSWPSKGKVKSSSTKSSKASRKRNVLF